VFTCAGVCMGFGAVNQLDHELMYTGVWEAGADANSLLLSKKALVLKLQERYKGSYDEVVHRWIVITSVNPPTRQMQTLCMTEGWNKVVVGDLQTPSGWSAPGCIYLSVEDQRLLNLTVFDLVPYNRYERKIFGYGDPGHGR